MANLDTPNLDEKQICVDINDNPEVNEMRLDSFVIKQVLNSRLYILAEEK